MAVWTKENIAWRLTMGAFRSNLLRSCGLIAAAMVLVTAAACVQDEDGPAAPPTATPTPTVNPALRPGGEWLPEVLSYAEDYGVTPEEAARRLTLQSLIEPYLEQFREIAPERQAGLWMEHEPEFKVVVSFTGADEGLEAAHRLAAEAPAPVEIRTGAPHTVEGWSELQQSLPGVAAGIGLFAEQDVLSVTSLMQHGYVELIVTDRPDNEAPRIAQELTAALGVRVEVEIRHDIPAWGTQPEQATADDPIARGWPSIISMGAVGQGTLVREGNCLYMEGAPGERWFLQFPYQSEWDAANNAVVIGGASIPVGATFEGGGGFAESARPPEDRAWGTRPDPACDLSRIFFLGSVSAGP